MGRLVRGTLLYLYLTCYMMSPSADCVAGTYYADKTITVCTLCPRGQYQSLPLQPSCNPCPAGLTTLNTGSVNIDYCIGESSFCTF